MNSDANKQAAIAAWQTFRTRDPEKIAAVFTEDAEWLAPENNATAVALNRPWHIIGRDQIARIFATEVRKLFVAEVTAEFRGFYADGNIVVIEQRLRATLANGNAYDNDYCFVLELENGLIRRVREYMDAAKGNRLVLGAG
jgi:ketosteroid isomerase-like protein